MTQTDLQSPPPAEVARAPLSSVLWDDGAPLIVDQRRLPGELLHWRLSTVDEVVDAIRTLAVRGAPAIGICGGYGVVVGLDEARPTTDVINTGLTCLSDRIGGARPTAVNLRWAVARVVAAARRAVDTGADPAAVRDAALAEALAIHDEDRRACAAIGEHGRRLLEDRRRILTHCNTGRLATGGDGTALDFI